MTGKSAGFDFGLKTFLTPSDETAKTDAPLFFKNAMKAVKKSNKALSSKKKDSNSKIGYIDRFFPSSKQCSSCGHINNALALRDLSWVCPGCGTNHDRDKNAAVNIIRKGASSLGLRDVRPACQAIPA